MYSRIIFDLLGIQKYFFITVYKRITIYAYTVQISSYLKYLF